MSNKPNQVKIISDAGLAMMRDIRRLAHETGTEDAEHIEFNIPICISGTDLRIVLQSGPRTAALNAITSAQSRGGTMPGMTRQDAIDKAAAILAGISHDETLAQESRAEFAAVAIALVKGAS